MATQEEVNELLEVTIDAMEQLAIMIVRDAQILGISCSVDNFRLYVIELSWQQLPREMGTCVAWSWQIAYLVNGIAKGIPVKWNILQLHKANNNDNTNTYATH